MCHRYSFAQILLTCSHHSAWRCTQTAVRQQHSGKYFDRNEIVDLFDRREASRHSVSKVGPNASFVLDLGNADKKVELAQEIGCLECRYRVEDVEVLPLDRTHLNCYFVLLLEPRHVYSRLVLVDLGTQRHQEL